MADQPVLTQTWDNLAVTTLARRAPKLVKQTLDRHPLLQDIETQPIVNTGMGLRIEVPLEVGRNTSAAYLQSPDAKMELIDQNATSMAVYRPSLLVCPLKFNRIEKIANSGKEQFVNLMTLKQNQALRTIRELVAINLHGNGTNLKTMGFGAYIPVDPTTGLIGGINRATNPYWRSQVRTIGSWATSGHLGSGSDLPFNLWIACTDGDEEPDASVWDQNCYERYHRSLGGLVRYINADTPGKILGDGLGYPKTNLMYQGKPAILDKKADPDSFFFIHRETFKLYVAPGMNMEPTEMMPIPGALGTFMVLIFFHQYVNDRPMINGRGTGVTN